MCTQQDVQILLNFHHRKLMYQEELKEYTPDPL